MNILFPTLTAVGGFALSPPGFSLHFPVSFSPGRAWSSRRKGTVRRFCSEPALLLGLCIFSLPEQLRGLRNVHVLPSAQIQALMDLARWS